MLVPIEVSARHVHLSREAVDILFGKDYQLTLRKELSQPGQYACEERIEVVGEKGILGSVSVLGPVRNITQVEISLTDARKIGIDCEIRESGDIKGTHGCTLRGPKGELKIDEGVIVAKRHIHMTPIDAEKIGTKNGEIYSIKVSGTGRATIMGDVVIRVSDKYNLAMHIDTDEANAINWKEGLKGEMICTKYT